MNELNANRKVLRTATAGAFAVMITASGTVLDAPAQAKEPPDAAALADWNLIAETTIFGAGTPILTGQLYLGFVSMAVHDAVTTATTNLPRRGYADAEAAAAVAAHDVLVEYIPGAASSLAADLTDSLDAVRDGPAKVRGIDIGEDAAASLIADRAGDGRGAPITYAKAPDIGIWRPTPPDLLPMHLPWFGFVDPLLLDSPTQIQPDGPDPLPSSDYAADFNEVKEVGALDSETRTDEQTQTARFWNYPVPRMFQGALRDRVQQYSLDINAAAEMFAVLNATTADAAIVCWRQKFDVGYWRPITAIHEAADDDNPDTEADAAWTPLVPTPPYPDYPSGHACLTGSYVAGLTALTGSDQIDVTVTSASTPETTRHYATGTALEEDAFNSRIWLGIHFRDAMEDGYYIGHAASAYGFAEFFD